MVGFEIKVQIRAAQRDRSGANAHLEGICGGGAEKAVEHEHTFAKKLKQNKIQYQKLVRAQFPRT